MKKLVFIFILGITISGCGLDPFMYNPDNSIETYELQNYTGDAELTTGPEYELPDSLITLFTLPPEGDRENDLYAVYLGDMDDIDEDTVFMYCHGNSGNLDYYFDRVKLLANVGGKGRFGVLMIDYQGYGLSKGTPTQENLYNDVDDALKWLKEMGLTEDRLIIYGMSLGSSPATYHASTDSEMNPAWLILEAPFAGAEVIAQDASKLALPLEFISDEDHDVAQMIKSVYQPFMWMHGVDDAYLAMKTHGEVVFKNYNGQRAVAHRIEGADHSDLPMVMGYAEYIQAVEDFILQP